MIVKRNKNFGALGAVANLWNKSGALGKTAMVAGGTALAGTAAAGGVYAKASKDALTGEMGKEFSSKDEYTEDWYKGEETEAQKKKRKSDAKKLAISSAALGTLIGAEAGSLGAQDKANKFLNRERESILNDAKKLNKYIKKGAKHSNPEVRAKAVQLGQMGINELKRRDFICGKAKNAANKKILKAAGIGAKKGLITGAAIGTGLAILGNKKTKESNEKLNIKRRNK